MRNKTENSRDITICEIKAVASRPVSRRREVRGGFQSPLSQTGRLIAVCCYFLLFPGLVFADGITKSLTFYGYVLSENNPVANARVEVDCNCGWHEIAYTNTNGYYEIFGGNHEGHRGHIEASAEGYLGTGYYIDPFSRAPTRIDFKLIRINSPAVTIASLGRIKAKWCFGEGPCAK